MFGVVVGVIAVGLVTLVVTLGLALLVQSSRKIRIVSKIPGPRPLPLLGNALELKTDGAEFYNQVLELSEEYRSCPIFKLLLGPQPFIILIHPESAEILFNTTKHITKSHDYDMLHSWLGTGLLTSTGEKWRTRRKLLTPTFHFHILTEFLHVFNEQCAVMISRLQKEAGQQSFDIFSYVTLCVLDIICETAMGKTVNAQGNANSEYVDAIYKISTLIQQRQKTPWLWPDWIYNILPAGKQHSKCLHILHGFTQKVIAERRAELEKQPLDLNFGDVEIVDQEASYPSKRRLAFLDMLLHMAKEADFTLMDIREEVDTFMFEGHDTTAAAANWAVHLIGSYPQVQARLHEEMDAIFGDSDRPVTMADIKEMKYLERVIKETLRLYPSVPMIGRTIEEDCIIGGYDIPEGATAVVVTAVLHRDPRHFPNPEEFDPDRFTLEKSAGRHPYAYIPFSAGLRNCIGQRFAMNEEKVLLSAILRNFTLEATQTTAELKPMGEIVLRPQNGIHVKLLPRK